MPVRDSRALWEMLMLEGFQAGPLLAHHFAPRREGFRAAFANFDPEIVAGFGQADVERLMGDAGIIRARAKILATIGGARAYLAMRDAGEDFADFHLGFYRRRADAGGWCHAARQHAAFADDFGGVEKTRL